MNGIVRSWACLNKRCGQTFDAWEPFPECPRCHGVRVQWIPGGGHVAGTAKGADSELRALTDAFGLTNLKSAREGEAAKVLATQPAPSNDRHHAMQFAPGFAQVPYAMDRTGKVHSVCAPSMQNVNFKTKLSTDVALGSGKMGFDAPQRHTHIQARHRQ